MKPTQLSKLLLGRANSLSKRPIMVWGPPGAGKSALVKAAAEQYGEFIDLRLANFDSVDMRGIPTASDGVTKWLTPETFPRDHASKGIIFFDEFPQAFTSVQNAASQIILDRRLGEYILPDGWLVVAAGNREADRAATNKMPSHIANRFTHIDYEVDAEDWFAWAYEAKLNPMVIAFLQFKTELLHKFDAKQRVNPTCRTWQYVSDDLSDDAMDDAMNENLLEIVAGTVGSGAATEFVGFCRVFRDLPDYETIRKRPEGCNVPEDVSVKYAIASMLAAMTKPEDMKPIMKYISRLPNEFQILATQEMTKRNKRLAETSAYIGWAAANKDLLLNATSR